MAFDAFLKIATVDGESTDSAHKQWIEVLGYSSGVTQFVSGAASTGGSRSAERADFSDFSITKVLDKTSPELCLATAKGTHFDTVTLELCRATGDKTPYMEYKMSDVLISSVQVGGSSAGELPTETVSFAFGKLQWTYTETDHKTGKQGGKVAKWWDLVENKGG